MAEQNYSNHRKFVFLFHVVLFFLILATFIGSLVNLFSSLSDHERLYSASLLVIVSISLGLIFALMRSFSTKVQDRAIRAEEGLRHYVLTGKLLDPRLTMGQIIALRFADNEEYLELVKRAAEEGLSNDEIKKAIKIWKADHHRV
jgi:hypothetical protein